jgi:hypothetical protein
MSVGNDQRWLPGIGFLVEKLIDSINFFLVFRQCELNDLLKFLVEFNILDP